MRDIVSYSRRALVGCAAGLPLTWFSGCGGGGADGEGDRLSADTDKKALAASPAPPIRAPRRRARVLLRQGVTALGFAADGTIATALSNGAVQLWALNGNRLNLSRALKSADSAPITGLVFTTDSLTLVTVGLDSTIQGWSVASGQRLFTLTAHEYSLRAIAANEQRIVTAGEGTRIMVWDRTTGRLAGGLSGHADFINTLEFSSDGETLASGDADARILLWKGPELRHSATLLGHADELNALAFAPNDNLLASAGEDAKVMLWNVASGVQVAALQGHPAPVRALAFNRNGKVLAGGTDGGSLIVWRKATRDVVQLELFPGGSINALRFDPRNPNRILAGSEDGQLRVANVAGNAGS